MTEAGKRCYKYDVSLPLPHLYDIVGECKVKLARNGYTDLEIMGYGHLGDGNSHVNIAVEDYSLALEQTIEPWIFEYVRSLKGSISAEHGIGVMKPQFLHLAKDRQSIDYLILCDFKYFEFCFMNLISIDISIMSINLDK